MNNKQYNKEITFEKIQRSWELFREYYLTPVELAELANRSDASGIYKMIKSNSLSCEEVNGVKKIVMTDIQTQSFLHDCLLKTLETINPVDHDENGNKVKSKIYLEYFALVETCSRLIHSLRLSLQPPDKEEETGFSRYEILQMRFHEIIEHINNGLIDVYDIIEILNLGNEEIETVKEVISGKRDFEYNRGVK